VPTLKARTTGEGNDCKMSVERMKRPTWKRKLLARVKQFDSEQRMCAVRHKLDGGLSARRRGHAHAGPALC